MLGNPLGVWNHQKVKNPWSKGLKGFKGRQMGSNVSKEGQRVLNVYGSRGLSSLQYVKVFKSVRDLKMSQESKWSKGSIVSKGSRGRSS